VIQHSNLKEAHGELSEAHVAAKAKCQEMEVAMYKKQIESEST
jgi:hypothetical protein